MNRLPLIAPLALQIATFTICSPAISPAAEEKEPPASTKPFVFPERKHSVMSWVPPYGIAKCKSRMDESYSGLGMKDGLTHLGLQFWVPSKEGGLERVEKYGKIEDAAVIELRDWAHSHGIRVLLCVFNGVETWDWSLVQGATGPHAREFTEALITEMTRLDLDGIDVDMEGNGQHEGDRPAFVAFVGSLAAKLHQTGKHITVDTFSYTWNAPNQTWWSELLPHVDGLTTMGYHETGADAAEWRSYAAQKSAAGKDAAKLMLGMPGDKKAWQGKSTEEQLDWVVKDGTVGISIWDAQLSSAAWKTRPVWSAVREIRGNDEKAK